MRASARFRSGLSLAAALLAGFWAVPVLAQPEFKDGRIDIAPPHISTDASVNYDYDIVYTRSPRWVEENGRRRPARWAEFAHLFAVTPGTDLMLLRPDGTEEVLVQGSEGAIQDPYVSFCGEWVYYTKFHKAGSNVNPEGADIFKVHVKTRETVQLTRQEFTPNKPGVTPSYGVYNMHPCPLPGGRVAFTSNRNAYMPPPKSYPPVAMQLHVMDDDGRNIETVGHLNLGGALHPVILKDGRLLFSSLENMGLRNYILWGIWSIHPDGTNWAPVVSALHGHSSPSSWHFQTQLSDENIVVELYYNQNQKGFGPLFKLPPTVPPGAAPFGPGDVRDPRNPGWMFLGRKGNTFRFPFTPYGMELLTPWIITNDMPSFPSVLDDPQSPRIGKVTHPCGAPDNHLLVSWTLGPIGGSAGAVREWMNPQPIDSGLYLIKEGQTTWEPGEMRLIKNDPDYNAQWPRPVVPYRRIYGVEEPARLDHKNAGQASPHLPEGTPFGLVGTSSMYKRESAPLGQVPEGSVTAVFPDELASGQVSAFTGAPWNWRGQGADAGRYENSDIHAIRVVAFEPNAHTDNAAIRGGSYGSRGAYPPYRNHPMERLRILGEIPVRKFLDGKQPTDPDGEPDTSFLAKLPADVAFTFQTIDKHGMVLNMAQTWHQVRPGEVRHDCGGCHAHSQQPTPFELTYAARPDYELFDLTEKTPLVTGKQQDQTGKQWDVAGETGVRFEQGPHDVEYFRDIRPIFERSCVACHSKDGDAAAGLVLDDDDTVIDNLPGTYFRLADDERARFSPRMLQRRGSTDELIVRDLFSHQNASHYIWKFQSRRSLLVWKLFGRRMDGWHNDDIPTEELAADDPRRQNLHIPRGPLEPGHRLYLGDIDYTGGMMPPPEAVKGTYQTADGKTVKVPPLSDEDRRTIVRWIDLGCPIDLHPEYDPAAPSAKNSGYLADDHRPTLTVTYPKAGPNPPLSRLLIGMHDYQSGLDPESFQVVADFAVDGVPAGDNLAPRLRQVNPGVWELKLKQPITVLPDGTLTVTIADREGNTSRLERSFSVGLEDN